MTPLEQLLREAWDDGYAARVMQETQGAFDIPPDHFFERYMEHVVDSLDLANSGAVEGDA
jgi:hypothetical protein